MDAISIAKVGELSAECAEATPSATEGSADRLWTRGHRGQAETFSAVCVTGQKHLSIFGCRKARFTGISECPIGLAAEDRFRPCSGSSYYAAVGSVSRTIVVR
jgi:hypothetical protein